MLQLFELMRSMGYELRSPDAHGRGGRIGDDDQQHRAGANAEQAGVVLNGGSQNNVVIRA
jgi:hypothetical protein